MLETRRSQRPPKHLWGAELVRLLPSLSVTYTDVMNDDVALLQLLRLVQRFGVAIVSNTPGFIIL
jgi:hypothetical protein